MSPERIISDGFDDEYTPEQLLGIKLDKLDQGRWIERLPLSDADRTDGIIHRLRIPAGSKVFRFDTESSGATNESEEIVADPVEVEIREGEEVIVFEDRVASGQYTYAVKDMRVIGGSSKREYVIISQFDREPLDAAGIPSREARERAKREQELRKLEKDMGSDVDQVKKMLKVLQTRMEQHAKIRAEIGGPEMDAGLLSEINAMLGKSPETIERERTGIFISYSHRNEAVVRKFADALIKLGNKVWLDEKNIGFSVGGESFGQNWKDEIEAGIKSCQKGFVVLSPEVFDRPDEVCKELEQLLAHEEAGEDVLVVPVLLNMSAAEAKAALKEIGMGKVADKHFFTLDGNDPEAGAKELHDSLKAREERDTGARGVMDPVR